jgi:hypothetical protein
MLTYHLAVAVPLSFSKLRGRSKGPQLNDRREERQETRRQGETGESGCSREHGASQAGKRSYRPRLIMTPSTSMHSPPVM